MSNVGVLKTCSAIYVERGRLEDVFRQLTGDEQGENA